MAAAAHNPAFAKKVGIPQTVATDFNQADKGSRLLSNAMKGSRPESPQEEAAEPPAPPREEFNETHQRARSRALRARA